MFHASRAARLGPVCLFAIGLVLLVYFAARAHADTNLPAICRGTPLETICPVPVVYDIPAPTDQVKGNGGYFATWSLFVGPDANAVVCPADIVRGSTTCPIAPITVPTTQVNLQKDPRTFTVSWTHDGHDATGANVTLSGFRIVYGTDASALTQTVNIADPNARSYTLQVPKFATTYYIAITALAGAAESLKSNTVSATSGGDPSIPPPVQVPTSPVLTVTAPNLTAYDLVKANDKLTAKAIGTVPNGTKCLMTIRALDMFGVPRASVKLTSGTRPQVVLAKCA